MRIEEKKFEFEKHISEKVFESKKLCFKGIDGYTVYNCSIPFEWKGKVYIYGRVEKYDLWASSFVRLFEKTGEDEYTLVRDSMIYQLEDPFISFIQGEMVLGGTHVRKKKGAIATYYGYFYRGTDLEDLVYFTTGPDFMKDIRLIDMKDGTIGVFSRPRNREVLEKYGSASMIGFARINSLSELSDEVVSNARPILGLYGNGEWGGCNQAYLLEGGKIGVIAHQSFSKVDENGVNQLVYFNTAFEFDPETFEVTDNKVIGTRKCYPDAPAKRGDLLDVTFTSGIVMREDGKVDLYAGIGDSEEGRIVIDYPFSRPLA